MSRSYFTVKGSKGTLQCLVFVKEHKDDFDNELKTKLDWICPKKIKKGNKIVYKECQLNRDVLKGLGLPANALDDFWPNRGPQWDGIAVGDNTLYLIEAKSHFSEIYSKYNSKSKTNKKTIKDRISEIRNNYGSNANIKIWMDNYYQIANRLAFLSKMKELSSSDKAKYNDVKLVFVNFENDPTWEDKAVPKDRWNKKYEDVLKELDIKKDKLKEGGVLIMCIDAKDW